VTISPTTDTPKKWKVFIECYNKQTAEQLSNHHYGPFKRRWMAYLVGWALAWDSCGNIACRYSVEESMTA